MGACNVRPMPGLKLLQRIERAVVVGEDGLGRVGMPENVFRGIACPGVIEIVVEALFDGIADHPTSQYIVVMKYVTEDMTPSGWPPIRPTRPFAAGFCPSPHSYGEVRSESR